ncbi:acyl-ACP--UDP-N-acetylglucosamine O-acyltransferase [Limoniibacter endophyticus]|uniref:Acyl-[acyl-carrier-protein]--UDP-N-acetylglucosamine O-acyltransferase n=1 Tax=Limoniibacter endophyticus TaxID=1565040 RepID=A0A8J3GG26_9HYPH|nr:acyl-[acyl-carrier-protein]--UDP-N-acetylglucosamine O-acyltransferase [Limoniibacter endophyticus]
MSTLIHPTAIIERGADLGQNVKIGPFCHVGEDVVLHDNVELISHVSIMGVTTIGAGTKVFPQAVLGAPPQNGRHKGGKTKLVIGANCTIREAVTMHAGTDTSRGETTVGDNGNFLAYSHIAHDCEVGNNVTFANNATLGGHVVVGNNVGIGGLAAVHQFVRIGDNAFIGGCSAVVFDVIPFGMAVGNRAKLQGLNVVGLKRSGLTHSQLHEVRSAYNMIFDESGSLAENIERAEQAFGGSAMIDKIISFLKERGKRHVTTPARSGAGGDADDAH